MYRKEYLDDIAEVVQKFQEDGMEVLLFHDLNQNFIEIEVREFYSKVGLINIYQHENNLKASQLPGKLMREQTM